MKRELRTDEKRLIEREFVARQAMADKRRRYARAVCVLGTTAGITGAASREFHVVIGAALFLSLVWLMCIAAYVGVGVFPARLATDMDARWHLNPWQGALRNLSEGKTQIEAIALLAGPILARLLFSFVSFGLK